MSLDRTSGFDMLVQVSEAELNTQLSTAFLAGTIFPPSMRLPVTGTGFSAFADVNLSTPVADLDRPRPRLGLTIPFQDSQLEIVLPVPAVISPLAGTITIVDDIEMITEGATQLAAMEFVTGPPAVTVLFDTASQAVLAPALTLAGLTLDQAQTMAADAVMQQLRDMGRLNITPPIPVVDDASPTTVFDIDVTTVNDVSAADRDCLAFGIRMANDSGGNINGITTSMIPPGSTSLVMLSNFWLLARVMRPTVAAALGRPITDFDTPLRLNRSIPAPGGTGTLTQLEARVVGNRIQIDGQATASGTGWSAVSNFTFFVTVGLTGGSLTVTATAPTVATDVSLEWWVWLLSLGLGSLFGGIIGAIVAAIVLAVVESTAEGTVSGLIAGGLGGSLGALPTVPLGPIGGGLTLTSVVLDDLEMRGSIVHSVSIPIKSQGQHDSSGSFTLDLDAGTIRGTPFAGADLTWDPGTGFTTGDATGVTVTGWSYGALTAAQISGLDLSSTVIPAALVPFSFDPFFAHNEIVLGVRTSEGRYAKVRAWRSLNAGGALRLEWTTYDNPIPQLDIAGRWSAIERGKVTESITSDCRFCRTNPIAWLGVFEAWPRLLAFPVDYRWCLCGEVIESGEGEVSTANGPLAYKLTGRRLEIQTDLGQNLDCELCLSAIDARGRELFTCVRLSRRGTEIECRQCTPRAAKFRLELVPAEGNVASWRPLLMATPPERQSS